MPTIAETLEAQAAAAVARAARISRHSERRWLGMPMSERVAGMPGDRAYWLTGWFFRAISPASCPLSTSSTIRISARVMMRRQSAWVSLAARVTFA